VAKRAADPADLFPRAREGDRGALARLLSLIEQGGDAARAVGRLAYPHTGEAYTLGITGAPGAGKSTLTSALIGHLRRLELEVAVLAIDPTSPFTGGAILGDRVRMQDHATDPGVFIRSMASRGQLGGLASSTPQALRVLDATGFDVVLVETVGVGQSEVDVAGAADTTVVLLAPGMGDGIQAAKAGLLEVGDVYVVNKADREGAVEVRRDLGSVLSHAERTPDAWRPPVLLASAQNGEGLDQVLEKLDAHLAWARDSGALERRRLRRARDEVEAIALTALRSRWAGTSDRDRLADLAVRVLAGEVDPYTAADKLLDS
jgi:LAO/AO transport system kinase